MWALYLHGRPRRTLLAHSCTSLCIGGQHTVPKDNIPDFFTMFLFYPPFQNVEYSSLADIDFMTSQAKWKRRQSDETCVSSSSVFSKTVKCLSADELVSLCKNLSHAGWPVSLSFIPDYCNSYILLCVQVVLPKPLTDLFQKEYMSLFYHMLLGKWFGKWFVPMLRNLPSLW